MMLRGLLPAIALLAVFAACATTTQLEWKCTDLVCFSMRVAGPERTVVVENRGETAVTVRPREGWARSWSHCCQILAPPSEIVVAPHERRDVMRFQLVSMKKHPKRSAVALLQAQPPFDVEVGGKRFAAPVAPETPADP
jgi:hypothetical protein